MSRICSKCNSPIPDDAAVCPKCGESVGATAADGPAEAQTEKLTPEDRPEAQSEAQTDKLTPEDRPEAQSGDRPEDKAAQDSSAGDGGENKSHHTGTVAALLVIILATAYIVMFIYPGFFKKDSEPAATEAVTTAAVPADVTAAGTDAATESAGAQIETEAPVTETEEAVTEVDRTDDVASMLDYAKRLAAAGNTEAAARVYDLLGEAIARSSQTAVDKDMTDEKKAAIILDCLDVLDLYAKLTGKGE